MELLAGVCDDIDARFSPACPGYLRTWASLCSFVRCYTGVHENHENRPPGRARIISSVHQQNLQELPPELSTRTIPEDIANSMKLSHTNTESSNSITSSAALSYVQTLVCKLPTVVTIACTQTPTSHQTATKLPSLTVSTLEFSRAPPG